MTTNADSFGVYGVTYTYGTKTILDSVSFEMDSGESLALLGPNGAGKSSLLKILAGIFPPSTIGKAKISLQIRLRGEEFGTSSSKTKAQTRARLMTYVAPELRAEFPITAYETVMMGRLCHHPDLFMAFSENDRKAVETAMQRCFCWELRDRDLDTLSGGEKQLVALARAVAQEARILLLDEVLSKMDLHHQARIGKLLRELATEGKSVILVSHDVNLAAEWASTALLLLKGNVIARGSIAEVMTEENFHRVYPGAKLVAGKNPVTGAPQIFFGG
jgi:iron complex transport system ATP-binding protein